MPFNVPDDWNSYYSTCSLCRSRYHQSEGGCDCSADLECECGKLDWIRCEEGTGLTCKACHTGPWEELSTKRTTHTARKNHADGSIQRGQRYTKTITLGYYPGGKFTRDIKKLIIEVG